MKIWTLMENTACGGLAAEHGLSLYIETGEHKILFDAGQSGAFAENAEKLGVDLRQVEFAVLSHGHYDHGGGLKRFLQVNERAKIYASQYAFEGHVNASGKDIGLDPALENCGRMVLTKGDTRLAPGIALLTCPLTPEDPAGLQMEEAGNLKPEDFRHEQYLLVEEQGKKILFSGCSHKGILQLMDYFRPDVLVGGFHFMKIEEEARLRRAAQRLMQYPAVYYTGHCTGEMQFAVLKESMEERLHRVRAGSIVEI